MKVVYAVRARQDIAEIYDHIAMSSPISAQRVEAGIRRVPLVRYPYAIFFRIDVARQLVEIARVIHGARVTDLGRLPDEG